MDGGPADGGPATCADSPCDVNASCDDASGSPVCTCDDGFTGDGATCTDVDECAATPGPCGAGTCTNEDGEYTCACPSGYTFDGTTCTDVDECAATPGLCGVGTCTNGDGTYACACPSGYAFDGTTCADVNECAATPGPCATGATCTNSPGSYSCACPSGFEVSGGACVDIDECTRGTDTCGANTACLNSSGSFTCECLSGFRPVTATTCAASRLLVYSPNDTTLTDAATALGYQVITTTEASWATLFDAGGFEAVIVSAPSSWPQAAMETRLPGYIAGGGRVLFAVWDLDESAPLKAAFGVGTTEMNAPRSIHSDGARFDLWNQQSVFPSPIAPNPDSWDDNGDLLTLTGAGYVAARFDSAAGPNATVVTNGGRTIVDGFLFSDLTSADGDADAIADAQELARNQINLLMNPRVLVHTGTGASTTVVPAVTRIGYTVRRTTDPAQLAASFDAGGFDLVMIDIPSDGYDAAVESRLTSWIGAGGRLVVSYWDLDAATALASAMGVSTATFDGAPSVHATSPVRASFFNLVQSVPTPLTGTDRWGDNGDHLTLTGSGFIAARFGSAASAPGATAVTHGDRVIVNGFLTDDLGTTDGDADGIADVHELYENQLHFLFLE